MSKDRKKLLHIHSSVNDKQPTPATLELGELGVNNAKGNAFISTKNSDGEVVRFSEDETIIGWMEQKEVFPYEGYMRGADNSQVDGVTEQDLLDNKSNLIIKLNQVVPQDTDYSPYDEKVNGAKDIYGNLINPISSGDYKDGAGLAIDMSNYAMIGANPSFSSITTTCHATLNGTTEIKGKGDGCGSKFTVEVANACIDATDTLNEYGVNHSNFGTSCDGTNISDDTTLKGKKIFIDSPSGDLTVDIQACNHISGRTNDFVIRECQDNGGKVEIDTTDIDVSASTTDIKSCDKIDLITDNFRVEQCNNGTTHIHSCGGITLESKNITLTDGDCGSGQTTIEVNDLCLVGERKINVYGDETNVGLDCGDSTIAANTRVFGKGTLITTNETPSAYAEENNIEIAAAQDIKENASRNVDINADAAITEIAPYISSDATGTTNGINYVHGDNYVQVKAGDIAGSAGNGVNIKLDKNGDLSETASNDITITASNNICDTAANNATFYGANKSDLGINCADNDRSTLTRVSGDTVNEGGNIVNTNAETSINETAPVINETATTSINEEAPTITESASTSISNTAPTLNYSGNTTNISGNTLVNINANGNEGDVAVHAKDDITVYADDLLCESGKTVTIFAGEGGKLTIGGNSCDGNTSGAYPITYVRRPKTGTCDIHATTVDDALDEVYDRSRISLTSTVHTDSDYSYTEYTLHQDTGTCDANINFTVNDTIVSMSASTNPDGATGETLTTYYLWQYIGGEKKDIGVINIPKDHLIEDVRIVYGTVVNDPTSGGQTFITCSTQSQDCHWYIEMKWYVWDGSHTDKWTYLPADDFVKDIDENNDNTDRGVNVDVWYNPTSGRNEVSADTTIHFTTPSDDNDFAYKKDGGEHYESGTTIIFKSGDVTDFSEKKYKPWSASTEINIPTDVCHLNRGKLTYSHNGFSGTFDPCSDGTFEAPHSSLTATYEATSGKSGSVVFNTSDDKNISIPTCVNHLNRHTIKFQSGSTSSFNNQTYDPGKDCANTSETINIPTEVSHLNRGKFTVKHCNQEVIFDPSTDTSITMTHSALTYTHNGFTGTYDPCTGGTFEAPHSALTISYGNPCDNDGNSITYDTSAAKSIIVPRTIADITNGKIDIEDACTSGNCISVNGNVCVDGTIKANALYSTSDERLKENISDIPYGEFSKTETIAFKSFNFKDDASKRKTYGIIAQDLNGSGLDNIVHEDENGNLSVDYTSFLILKIASLEDTIKRMQEEIENLKGGK